MGSSTDIIEAMSGNLTAWAVSEQNRAWEAQAQIDTRAQIDLEFLATHIDRYIKENLSIDVVSWGDNEFSLRLLVDGKVLSEKTIEIKVEKK